MSATNRPFETAWEIVSGSSGWIAGWRSGKMKWVNSATPGPMKMNHARKPGERHPVEQPERGQRVQGRSDEGEDDQKGPLGPADVEQAAHGGPEAGEVLLGHVDLERRDRQEEQREDHFGGERLPQVVL